MNTWRLWSVVGALLLGPGLSGPARAQQGTEAEKVFAEARQAAQHGPRDITLTTQATLHLPAGHFYVAEPLATRVLNAMGNPGHDAGLQGIVFPGGDEEWFATLRYEASGYIKDDDARNWNADDMLQSFRDGTERANEERQKMGVAALEIVGWAEKPTYDAASHRLVWAMSSRHKGAAANDPQGVNYNTYALGREGYLSLNLVTTLAELPSQKGAAHALLGALEYQPGKAYADFSASTDKVAEYGLAALVVGLGAKKLGLIAVILAFAAKFAKVIALVALGFGGVFAKWFRRKTPGA